MGSHFKQLSFNTVFFSILVGTTPAQSLASPGTEYFEALREKKPKTPEERKKIKQDTFDKALVNEANRLSKMNQDYTRKMEAELKKAEEREKKQIAEQDKADVLKHGTASPDESSAQFTDTVEKKSDIKISNGSKEKPEKPSIRKNTPSGDSTADIKVESNMPDEVDFNEPTKATGADAVAPTPVPAKSK
jgi:hypothetical protein